MENPLMTQKMTHAPGTFSWPELSTSSQSGAETFYAALFGWTIEKTPMGPDAHYTIFQKDGAAVAAASTLQPDQVKQGVPPNWLSYVSVASVDASVEKAKSLGATLCAGPFDVMEHGRMAVLMDPQGAAFALWQAKNHQGAGLLDAPGALTWTELVTSDTKKAGEFYTGLFPWKSEVKPMPGMEYTIFKRGDASAGGMMALLPEMKGVPPHWMPYFGVTDCDATTKKATDLKGSVIMAPHDIPGVGRFAILKDPQGAAFAIFQVA
jgi:predicted enzyme related to lactoylglutathione lyase